MRGCQLFHSIHYPTLSIICLISRFIPSIIYSCFILFLSHFWLSNRSIPHTCCGVQRPGVRTFWFCWVHFLAKSIKHAIEHDEDEYAQSIGNAKADREGSDSEDEAEKEQTKGYDSFGNWNKGVVTITVKNATKLSPMDTCVHTRTLLRTLSLSNEYLLALACAR